MPETKKLTVRGWAVKIGDELLVRTVRLHKVQALGELRQIPSKEARVVPVLISEVSEEQVDE